MKFLPGWEPLAYVVHPARKTLLS